MTRFGTAFALLFVLGIASGATARAANAPYEINVVIPQTGPAAFVGQSIGKMLDVVTTLVNAQGGIKGRAVKFIIHDDASNPALDVQIITQLIAEHVPVIIGPASTGPCAAAMPLVSQKGPVMYCLAAGIVPPAGSYAFVNGATPDEQVRVLIRYFRERGWKRLAIVSSTDATGQSWDRGVQYSLALPENRDVRIVAYEHMNPTDLSIAGGLARVKAADPQAIVTFAAGATWGTIIRNVNDAGIDVPVAGNSAVMSIPQLKSYQSFLPPDLYFSGLISAAPNSVGPGPIRDVQAAYFRAFQVAGLKPDLVLSVAWDPTMIVIRALQALGPDATDTQIRDYIGHLHGFVGINGIYDFRDGSQRGIGANSFVVDKWDAKMSDFVPVSRPAGFLR